MIITSKNYYFFAALFFLLAFALFIYLIIVTSPLLFAGFFSNWRYFGIILVTALYLMAYLVVSRTNCIARSHICTPSVLFLCVLGFYIYAGTLDHYLQVVTQAKFTYIESLTCGYNYISLSLVSWICAYLAGQTVLKGKSLRHNISGGGAAPKTSALAWNKKRLYLTIVFWGGIGITAFIIFFLRYIGGFPALQGTSPNASPELRAVVSGKAHNITVIAFNATTMAIMSSGIFLVIYRKNKFIITLLFVVSIMLFLLWGARIYIALPFMVVFLLFVRKNEYSLKATFGMLVIIIIVGSVYGLVRNIRFYRSHGLKTAEQTEVEMLANLHIAPEFRDTLGVISHLDELQAQYKPDYYLKGVYLTALPQKILTLFGVDKDILFSEKGIGSGWLIAKVTRGYDWGGLRPGIMGQTLMAFGVKGVIVVFFLHGLLFSQLDKLSKRYCVDSPSLVFVYIVTVIFAFSIIGTTHGVFAKFWYFTYGYLLTITLAAKKTRRSVSVKSV